MLRCEDCIPLIEEYFDGEVDAKVSEQMSAHISVCADCAAALDALSFEGEIYAHYERGLEPTPALWARVSAEIAREAQPETPTERRPFLSRARASLVAAFGALSLRPALASSLALLVVGLTAGSLWLARRPQTQNPTVASRNDIGKRTVDASPSPVVPTAPPVVVGGNEPDSKVVEVARVEKIVRPNAIGGPRERGKKDELTDADINALLGDGQQLSDPNATAVKADAANHAVTDEIAGLVDTPKVDTGNVNANAQSPDAGAEEIARHVEQAQMLLRSIKNVRAGEEGTVNVAYEKNLSRQLLADNATLKLEAEVKGDKDAKQVLDTIEPFLLDIANMREQASREEVRSIRERVEKTEIIAWLQVY
jgi:hypothetical protein